MKPVYLDLHIHTSSDPNKLNENYNLDALIGKVKEKAQGDEFLISFTDHNVINEKIYLLAAEKIKRNLILGVELHVRSHEDGDTKAYHCHIYFNLDDNEITSEIINDINARLDALYPKDKLPLLDDKDIPTIQKIIEKFDEYDFILLPHGGQTHSTFDKATPDGREFDNAMQRSIYYNFFDGFTSRSDKKTKKTREYLERLGVQEFVNLITGTDNYDPNIYPHPHTKEEYEFIPTWMFATPTFNGLRLSLSDCSRFEYNQEKPKKWRDSIKSIKLKTDNIDIDINLTPGLNVIIGESSSGKTLLVDSLFRRLANLNFEEGKYFNYGVDKVVVDYPDGLVPHFIEQNFVISVTREDKKINDIGIIKKILPDNSEARKKINKGFKDLNEYLNYLFDAVEQIERLELEIDRIPILSALITTQEVNENILKNLLNTATLIKGVNYGETEAIDDLEFLNKLDKKLINNPFIEYDKKIILELKSKIEEMRLYSDLENKVKTIIQNKKNAIDKELKKKEGEAQNKKQEFDRLLSKLSEYYNYLLKFERALENIANFSIAANSKEVKIKGYVLSVENKLVLNKDIIKNQLNSLLLRENEIKTFEEITPEKLFRVNFKNNLKGIPKNSGITYKLIIENINTNLIENDEIKYKIYTPDGRDFDSLSPGLKTAIILELILHFEGDSAPIIIDQPEDNLATSYMNDGLVKSIKDIKTEKQIIFVSHNATIPMAGDAQNIILCENKNGKINIRSAPLEGKIHNINVVDYIAKIADGGKPSIKKRFKKYNLKKFNDKE